MLSHLRSNLLLLVLTVAVCCVLYPGVLLVIGQTAFHNKAEGSLLYDKEGKPIGSRLIAQPFTGAHYFQPRPSAVSYNAAGSGASNWGANNYLLRDRVARALGPIVKYASGPQKGQPVGPDVENWFQNDQFAGSPGIVAQWAAAHPTLATNWVKADPQNGAFVTTWQGAHSDEVAQWIKNNSATPEPKPEELAGLFFASFSKENPGKFPSGVEHATEGGQVEKVIEPVSEGSDIQSIFFDMWRQEHASADLEPVPADMVMASGSGLDPHITMKNARYQIDRVAAAWAAETKGDVAAVRKRIEELLRKHSESPLGGLVGVEIVNVLEVNLALRAHFAANADGAK
ncbi:MAG: potassium-transporting ATPase subunit C [Planctomycetaceae bacterium]|nr:MAG: potassium-transporting ATPase subunit C [Planctomycetaceae bacterium]